MERVGFEGVGGGELKDMSMGRWGGGVCSCIGAGDVIGGSRVSFTLRNVLGMRVQLWRGLLAPGHSHDEEPGPILSQSGSLGRA